MESVERHLISDRDGLVRLLAPPFQHTPEDPGYIKGYVAGVRENGGQYTHAALWVVRAMAVLGRRDRAAALLAMLSPVSHARTPRAVARYRVEPYVIAADVYGAPPHVGRGGWTWYTGSSGWMYRVALESILGLRLVGGNRVELRPCVPDAWPQYRVAWAPPGQGGTRWRITVRNPRHCSECVVAATLDGRPLAPEEGILHVPLVRDGALHELVVDLGPRA
jgi:cyclic beta-1,2-glucan synthetase